MRVPTWWLLALIVAVGAQGGQELKTLTPELAGQAIGQMATVCGEVVGLSCDQSQQAWTLALRTAPGTPEFVVPISLSIVDQFETPLEDRYYGQSVCVTGTVRYSGHGYSIWPQRSEQLSIREPRRSVASPFSGLNWACDPRVTLPRIVKEVRPSYTAAAMRARIAGTVQLMAIVDVDGSVRRAEVIRSLDPENLDQQAIKAVMQWRFEPGTRDGVAVPVVVGIEMTFTLKKN